MVVDPGSDAQESGVILVTMIHARDHADSDDTRTFRQRRKRGGERRGRKGVSDDCDLIRREASTDQATSRGLRIADNSIAPTKNRHLSPELPRWHQLSGLALAPRNSR